MRWPMFMFDCPVTEDPHHVSSSWALHWNTSLKKSGQVGGGTRHKKQTEGFQREWLILDVDVGNALGAPCPAHGHTQSAFLNVR